MIGPGDPCSGDGLHFPDSLPAAAAYEIQNAVTVYVLFSGAATQNPCAHRCHDFSLDYSTSNTTTQ